MHGVRHDQGRDRAASTDAAWGYAGRDIGHDDGLVAVRQDDHAAAPLRAVNVFAAQAAARAGGEERRTRADDRAHGVVDDRGADRRADAGGSARHGNAAGEHVDARFEVCQDADGIARGELRVCADVGLDMRVRHEHRDGAGNRATRRRSCGDAEDDGRVLAASLDDHVVPGVHDDVFADVDDGFAPEHDSQNRRADRSRGAADGDGDCAGHEEVVRRGEHEDIARCVKLRLIADRDVGLGIGDDDADDARDRGVRSAADCGGCGCQDVDDAFLGGARDLHVARRAREDRALGIVRVGDGDNGIVNHVVVGRGIGGRLANRVVLGTASGGRTGFPNHHVLMGDDHVGFGVVHDHGNRAARRDLGVAAGSGNRDEHDVSVRDGIDIKVLDGRDLRALADFGKRRVIGDHHVDGAADGRVGAGYAVAERRRDRDQHDVGIRERRLVVGAAGDRYLRVVADSRGRLVLVDHEGDREAHAEPRRRCGQRTREDADVRLIGRVYQRTARVDVIRLVTLDDLEGDVGFLELALLVLLVDALVVDVERALPRLVGLEVHVADTGQVDGLGVVDDLQVIECVARILKRDFVTVNRLGNGDVIVRRHAVLGLLVHRVLDAADGHDALVDIRRRFTVLDLREVLDVDSLVGRHRVAVLGVCHAVGEDVVRGAIVAGVDCVVLAVDLLRLRLGFLEGADLDAVLRDEVAFDDLLHDVCADVIHGAVFVRVLRIGLAADVLGLFGRSQVRDRDVSYLGEGLVGERVDLGPHVVRGIAVLALVDRVLLAIVDYGLLRVLCTENVLGEVEELEQAVLVERVDRIAEYVVEVAIRVHVDGVVDAVDVDRHMIAHGRVDRVVEEQHGDGTCHGCLRLRGAGAAHDGAGGRLEVIVRGTQDVECIHQAEHVGRGGVDLDLIRRIRIVGILVKVDDALVHLVLHVGRHVGRVGEEAGDANLVLVVGEVHAHLAGDELEAAALDGGVVADGGVDIAVAVDQRECRAHAGFGTLGIADGAGTHGELGLVGGSDRDEAAGAGLDGLLVGVIAARYRDGALRVVHHDGDGGRERDRAAIPADGAGERLRGEEALVLAVHVLGEVGVDGRVATALDVAAHLEGRFVAVHADGGTDGDGVGVARQAHREATSAGEEVAVVLGQDPDVVAGGDVAGDVRLGLMARDVDADGSGNLELLRAHAAGLIGERALGTGAGAGRLLALGPRRASGLTALALRAEGTACVLAEGGVNSGGLAVVSLVGIERSVGLLLRGVLLVGVLDRARVEVIAGADLVGGVLGDGFAVRDLVEGAIEVGAHGRRKRVGVVLVEGDGRNVNPALADDVDVAEDLGRHRGVRDVHGSARADGGVLPGRERTRLGEGLGLLVGDEVEVHVGAVAEVDVVLTARGGDLRALADGGIDGVGEDSETDSGIEADVLRRFIGARRGGRRAVGGRSSRRRCGGERVGARDTGGCRLMIGIGHDVEAARSEGAVRADARLDFDVGDRHGEARTCADALAGRSLGRLRGRCGDKLGGVFGLREVRDDNDVAIRGVEDVGDSAVGVDDRRVDGLDGQARPLRSARALVPGDEVLQRVVRDLLHDDRDALVGGGVERRGARFARAIGIDDLEGADRGGIRAGPDDELDGSAGIVGAVLVAARRALVELIGIIRARRGDGQVGSGKRRVRVRLRSLDFPSAEAHLVRADKLHADGEVGAFLQRVRGPEDRHAVGALVLGVGDRLHGDRKGLVPQDLIG